jgi:ATP-dependent Clp protease protease subunit
MQSSGADMGTPRLPVYLIGQADMNSKRNELAEAAEARPAPLVAEALFKARTVLIFGEIDMRLAGLVTAQLLALAAASADPIRVVINSPGGHVESGDTLHDLLRFIDVPVHVVGTGWVASAGALIYVAVKPDRRFALPNTRFLLHQPLGGVGGPASDVEIEARQVLAMRERLNRIFARETGQPYEKVARDTDRNFWMNALEAKEYGLVHRVIQSVSEI